MQHYSNFLKYKCNKKFFKEFSKFKLKKLDYIDIAIGLDTETSSTIYNGTKVAWIYIWQIAIDNIAYYGRTLEELKLFLHQIDSVLKELNVNAICWIQNMGYEFTFMSSIFQFHDIFALGDNKPCDMWWGNINFRDSMVFMNMNLAMIAKNYCKTQKLVGDLDYTIVRYPDTELSTQELAYCENDVLILNELWEYHILPEYIYNNNRPYLPLTNTAKVRKYTKDLIPYKGKHFKYMQKMFPDQALYDAERLSFIGGFVHGNYLNAGYWINNSVFSEDLTSSYPATILYCYYPITPFHLLENPLDNFKFDNKNYAKLMLVELTDLKSTSSNRIISYSKLISPENATIDNGRVITCDKAYIWVNELDLETYSWFYDFKIRYLKVYIAGKGFLPKFIMQAVLHFYKLKSELKGVKGSEKEYMRSKNMLNSIFGMMVSRLNYDELSFNFESNEWEAKESELECTMNTFLAYQWGLWVTANARYTLLKSVREIGDDVVYCDTDSIKFKNEYHLSLFEKENKRIRHALTQAIKLNGFEGYLPYIKGIGEWDLESVDDSGNPKPYTRFKTLGAKKYCYDNHIVCSGINRKYLNAYAEEQGKEPWEIFEDGLVIPPDKSGKTTMLYCFNSEPIEVQYELNGVMHSLKTRNYVHAEPASFKMNIGTDYNDLLEFAKEIRSELERNIYKI